LPTRDDWFEAERLHRAAQDGTISEMAELVTAGYDVNAFDDMSYTPLHCAVGHNRPEAAAWLLDHGADINANEEAKIGETALCLAVQGAPAEIVEMLLKRGADPDIPGWMGLTARMRAQRRNDEPGRKIAALLERYPRRS
jgi:ankyrin repeat protein